MEVEILLISSEEPLAQACSIGFSSGFARVSLSGLGIRPQKIDKWKETADTLAKTGGKSSTGNAPLKYADEKRIEKHIYDTGGNCCSQPELRPFGSNQEALENILQHECCGETDHDSAVKDTVFHHIRRSAEKGGNGTHEQNAGGGQNDSEHQSHVYQHGEIVVRFVAVALSEDEGHKGGSAGADHKSHTA